MGLLEQKINGRQMAQQLIQMIEEEADNVLKSYGAFGSAGYWEKLREWLERRNKPKVEPPMGTVESRAFGARQITFGKYDGDRIDEIPFDYLELIIEPDEFKKDLKRYLQSERIRRERI